MAPCQRTRVPHIWPCFGQMWDPTALESEVLRHNRHFRASIRKFPHLAKAGRDMGHPRSVVQRQERPVFLPRPCLEVNSLIAEEEDAGGLVFSHVTHRAVKELVVFEIDLKEGWPLGDSAGDQCFR